ncbi:YaiI/YqxD family protein [Sansalvadorimonas verongulae]|uniref:YaiI/YqxD family protein n=1 Tax=Sansalvadorimonas verongulae TaxID=2172824 RepID=UPI0012BD75B5|nr:YaiI/YqxD family protein [Sansalvadorimonas verongulae]MTI13056.1 YaiI/YqxD family protein [Sansalvadorimonas verongulae]
MKIWVDADACPNVIKEILFKAAQRTKTPLTLVANQYLRTPPSPFINAVQVPSGFDVADNYIVQDCSPGDLVITADIPLAAEVLQKKAHALNPRGEFYDQENIRHRLAMRNFMEEMRSTGQVSGGPPPLGNRERMDFANALDRFLAQNS